MQRKIENTRSLNLSWLANSCKQSKLKMMQICLVVGTQLTYPPPAHACGTHARNGMGGRTPGVEHMHGGAWACRNFASLIIATFLHHPCSLRRPRICTVCAAAPSLHPPCVCSGVRGSPKRVSIRWRRGQVAPLVQDGQVGARTVSAPCVRDFSWAPVYTPWCGSSRRGRMRETKPS